MPSLPPPADISPSPLIGGEGCFSSWVNVNPNHLRRISTRDGRKDKHTGLRIDNHPTRHTDHHASLNLDDFNGSLRTIGAAAIFHPCVFCSGTISHTVKMHPFRTFHNSSTGRPPISFFYFIRREVAALTISHATRRHWPGSPFMENGSGLRVIVLSVPVPSPLNPDSASPIAPRNGLSLGSSSFDPYQAYRESSRRQRKSRYRVCTR